MPEDRNRADDSGSINARAIVWTGIALVAVILTAGIAARIAWQTWRPTTSPDGPNAAPTFTIAKPVLDSAPQPALAAYFAEKKNLLNSWQWVDRPAGTARIPLAQAMQLMAQRHAATSEQK